MIVNVFYIVTNVLEMLSGLLEAEKTERACHWTFILKLRWIHIRRMRQTEPMTAFWVNCATRRRVRVAGNDAFICFIFLTTSTPERKKNNKPTRCAPELPVFHFFMHLCEANTTSSSVSSQASQSLFCTQTSSVAIN